jgi:pseudouridine kinase
MTEREQQVLDILKNDPLIQQNVLAEKLGCSRSAVAGHIMNLMRKGFIQGKGYIIAPEKYAVVIGGANMDLCGRSDNTLIVGDSNPGSLTSSAGGVGRNIADNMGRLGSSVQFIGVVGGDAWGEQLLQSCRNAHVGVEHSLVMSGRTSSNYLSIHGPDGEMQLALNDMKLIDELNSEQLAKRSGVLNRSSAIVIDANLSDSALDYLFHAHGDKAILVDPVSSVKASKLIPYLSHIHTLKPNRLEAELLSGVTINSDEDLPTVANTLHGKGVKHILISLGAKGAYASVDGVGQRISADKTQVNNVTGAGDALMAGLSHGFLQGWSWDETVNFALGAARLALLANTTINSVMSEQAVHNLLEESFTC